MMSISKSLQSLNSPILEHVTGFFNFFTKPLFFLVLFSIFFLMISKKQSFKILLCFLLSFFVGDVTLKRLFYSARPYDADASLFATRGILPSSSFISTSLILNSSFSTLFILQYHLPIRQSKNKSKLKLFALYFLSFAFLSALVFTKLFRAENNLIDLLIGIAFGIVLGVLVHKFVKMESGLKSLLLMIIPLVTLLINIPDFFVVKESIRSFEFSGIFMSVILGMFLEKKYIGYKIADNFITFLLKSFVLIIVFLSFHFLIGVLPAFSILHFAIYFVLGLIVTMLLPMLFKIINKYVYVFSSNVEESKIVFSSISLSPRATKNLASKLKRYIYPGDVVILSGDLGAGKSEITRAFLMACGVKSKITSPTFTLVNVYSNEDCKFYHFDMYRLEDEEETRNIGFEEMINDENAIKFIEWAERIPSFLPEHYKKITIVKLGKNSRNIILEQY